MRDSRFEYITSRTNAFIIETAKLRDKKFRDVAGCFSIEGVKLYKEALSRGVMPTSVIVTVNNASLLDLLPENEKIRKIIVTDSVYEKITNENSPQGVFCIIKHLDKFHKFDTIYSDLFSGKVFIADKVRDPGNLGTVMRTALAMGIDTLVMSDECADIYNPKVVRASMGALFSLHTLKVSDLPELIKKLINNGYKVFSAALDENAQSLRELKTDSKTVFVVGNEGVGLSEDIISASSGKVYIPMQNNCESLNVSVAASILMWSL